MKKSSCISSVDVSGSDLIVTFTSGKTYGFSGAASHAPALRNAPSVGGYFNAEIRGKFDSVAL